MKKLFECAVAILAVTSLAIAQQPAKAPAKSPAASKKIVATNPTPDADSGGPTVATAEAFLKRMFGYNENLAFHVSSVKPTDAPGLSEVTAVVNTPQGQQVLRFFVTSDSQHAIMGEMMPYGTDPFMKIRDQLKKEAFGAAKGPEDAPMQIVEFADLECPACKTALPSVEKLQQEFPGVRFIFQSFPLVQLHPWAETGAKYLDCISRQSNDAAWKFIESVYAHQGEITAANAKQMLDKYAGFADQDAAKIGACVNSPETAARIKKSIDLANQISVSSTPTLFVNGRGIAGMNPQDYDALKSIVQYELDQAKQGK
jgi:protein-disulfide isomerase